MTDTTLWEDAVSDVIALVRAKLRSSAKQRLVLGILAVLTALFLAVSALVDSSIEYYNRNIRPASSLSLIEISATSPSAQRTLDGAALAEIAAVPKVVAVHGWTQFDLSLPRTEDWPDHDTNPGALWATPYIEGLVPRILAGEIGSGGPAVGEIILPDRVAGGSLKALVGRDVEFSFTEVIGPGQGQPASIRLKVIAIVDNSVPDKAGSSPAYLAEAQLKEIRDRAQTSTAATILDSAYVRVSDPAEVNSVQAELARRGFAVSSLANQVPSLGDLFSALDAAQTVLGIVAAVIALALGAILGAAWGGAKTREIGLLKALGWSTRRVAAAINAEYFSLGLIAALTGSVLGVLASLGATTALASMSLPMLSVQAWTPPSWTTLLGAIVILPLCVCIGGLLSGLKAARIEPDAALRDL